MQVDAAGSSCFTHRLIQEFPCVTEADLRHAMEELQAGLLRGSLLGTT
jgi:hypothetical protein